MYFTSLHFLGFPWRMSLQRGKWSTFHMGINMEILSLSWGTKCTYRGRVGFSWRTSKIKVNFITYLNWWNMLSWGGPNMFFRCLGLCPILLYPCKNMLLAIAMQSVRQQNFPQVCFFYKLFQCNHQWGQELLQQSLHKVGHQWRQTQFVHGVHGACAGTSLFSPNHARQVWESSPVNVEFETKCVSTNSNNKKKKATSKGSHLTKTKLCFWGYNTIVSLM